MRKPPLVQKERGLTKPRGLVPVFASGGLGHCGFWAPTRWTVFKLSEGKRAVRAIPEGIAATPDLGEEGKGGAEHFHPSYF